MRDWKYRLAVVWVLICAAAGPAWPHDRWLSGQAVDPKTRELCCSEADTKIADDLVQSAPGGVTFSDRPTEVITWDRIQPSPDGHWWRSVWGDKVRCVFGPYSY